MTLTWQGSRNSDSSSEVVPLPVPYELPPQPYTSEGMLCPSVIAVLMRVSSNFISSADVPWSWDRRYTRKMFMVKFGHDKYSFILSKIPDILNVYILKFLHYWVLLFFFTYFLYCEY